MRTEKIAQGSPLNGMPRELGREHWGRGEDRQASLPPFCTGPEGGMAQWASPHSLPSYPFGLLRIILWNPGCTSVEPGQWKGEVKRL